MGRNLVKMDTDELSGVFLVSTRTVRVTQGSVLVLTNLQKRCSGKTQGLDRAGFSVLYLGG